MGKQCLGILKDGQRCEEILPKGFYFCKKCKKEKERKEKGISGRDASPTGNGGGRVSRNPIPSYDL